jgi:hypothetical protein
MTLVWAALMAVFACAFSTSTGNVYITGLTIAGYTYGALLGAFLLGRLVRRANEVDAILSFLITVGVMTYMVRGVKIDVTTAAGTVSAGVAAQWLVPLGVVITLAVGGLLSLFHQAPDIPHIPADGGDPAPGSDRVATAA